MVCHSEDSRAQFVLCSSPTQKDLAVGRCTSDQNVEESGDDVSVVSSGGGGVPKSSGACVRLTPGSNTLFQSTEFIGSKSLHLKVRLWTEKQEAEPSPDLAWQHAQLFRQKVGISRVFPLFFCVNFFWYWLFFSYPFAHINVRS